jgi:thiamine-monophosphate kinase
MILRDVGEIGLIRKISRGLPLDSSVVIGIGDDAAAIRWTKDKYLLLACDMVVEGVHFRTGRATPLEIGWKALARNVSDIAAMGGIPRYAMVSVGIDPGRDAAFLDGIYKGIKRCAKNFKVNIVGGDMARSKGLVIDISIAGEVERSRLVTRSGAKRGDLIFVTGSLGGASKGKHLNFIPRLKEARMLTEEFGVNAMIDISDGLLLDLWRILDASKAGARIYENAIPVAPGAGSFERAVSEGEDFELLFTMAPGEARRFMKHGILAMPVEVTLIGEVMDRRYGYYLVTENGRKRKILPRGYLHF